MQPLRTYTAALLIAAMCASAVAQQSAAPSATPATSENQATATGTAKVSSNADRRRAAKLFVEATKLYQKQQFEQALSRYEEASRLDATNPQYPVAAEVARSHAVTALMQDAAQQRTRGNLIEARAALTRALTIEPGNKDLLERLMQVGGMAPEQSADAKLSGPALGGMDHLAPTTGVHNFHLRSSQRQIIQQVFHAWGIEATVDDSIRGNVVRLDLDQATFEQATHAVSLLTDSFYVPVDAHRALVARDTREMRTQYMRNGLETLPLSGLSATEMTDMANMARNVFELTQAVVNPTAATITLRGPEKTLQAFNATYEELMDGRSEVLVDVRLLQLAHTNARDTGVQPTQQIGVFNVLAEARSILQANQDLVNQIIASGLAAPGDIATILGILLASGQVSSSLFSSGLVEFGGKCDLGAAIATCSPFAFAAAPGKATFHLNLNSSDSRQLENFRLRLEDGEEGTLKSGSRYPIQTSSYSSLSSNTLHIPGLTGAGNSSALSGLLAGLQGAAMSIPQVQYEDLGLTLKARPRVMRSGDVALTLDMKIAALAGGTVNGVPVLANRAYSGVVTLPADQSVLIAGEVDKTESRAISGIPGLSEIPGLNNATEKNTQKNYATLLIILTPHVVRSPHGLVHTPRMPVDRAIR